MKILNLYACLGGNRYKWDEVANIQVTAVELDPELARMYKQRFPKDTVIIADAHKYLIEHYQEFDFIWSSPPCPTHSRVRISQKNKDFFVAQYPNMKLYEEIIFLKHNFKGKYVVENVIPYYQPLIFAQKRGRHLYWSNFRIPTNISDRISEKGLIGGRATNQLKKLCEFHEIDLSSYKGNQLKQTIARNLVDFQAGKTIFETAMGIIKKTNAKQIAFSFSFTFILLLNYTVIIYCCM